MKQFKIFFFSFFLFLMSLTSCKVTKKLFKRNLVVHSVNLENFFSSADSAKIPFKSLKIRFTGKINTKDNSLNIGGQLRILKDSLIWANATALFGIEVGRVLLTKDSVFLQNNLKHIIDIWPIKKFLSEFGVQADVSGLQSIFLGQFIHLKADSFTLIENLQKDSSSYHYQAKYLSINNKKSFDYLSSIHSFTMLVDSFSVLQMPEQNKLMINYQHYLKISDYIFPASFSLFLEKPNSTDKFVINYKKIYINKSFSIPALSLEDYKIIKH